MFEAMDQITNDMAELKQIVTELDARIFVLENIPITALNFSITNVSTAGYTVSIDSFEPLNATFAASSNVGFGVVREHDGYTVNVDVIGDGLLFDPQTTDLPLTFDVTRETYASWFDDTEQRHTVSISLFDDGITTLILETAGILTPVIPGVVSSEVYNWSDLIYRNDAQDPGGYTLDGAGNVTAVHDLSPNQAHLNRHVVGRGTPTSHGGIVNGEGVLTPDGANPMILSSSIGGYNCFDGYVIQGKPDSLFLADAGNVVLSNSDNSFSMVHVYKLTQAGYFSLVSMGYRDNWRGMMVFNYTSSTYVMFETSTVAQEYPPPGVGVSVALVLRIDLSTPVGTKDGVLYLEYWDIETGVQIGYLSTGVNQISQRSLTAPGAAGSPLFIGCDSSIFEGTNQPGETIHGETIIFNRFLRDDERDIMKDHLIDKWRTSV